MPQFDLRYIQAAKYTNTSGTVTYAEKTPVGDAMSANLEMRFAEGRLYAEGRLSEYMRLATGGTISLGVKEIPDAAKKLLYGAQESTRSVPEASGAKGVVYSAKDAASYVGVSLYCPDVVDGVTKYTCVFIAKALFGPPSMSYKTKGQNLEFATPTTTGEFLASDAADETIMETVTLDTIEAAKAWCDAVLTTAGG